MMQDAYNNWLEGLRNPKVPQVKASLADYGAEDSEGHYDPDKVIGVCALGMACLTNNMALRYHDGVHELGIPFDLETAVEVWNDNEGLTFAQIADKLEAYNRKYPFVGDEVES